MATLTELHRKTKSLVRQATQGQVVRITEHGQPVAKLSRDYPKRLITVEEFRSLEITNEAINDAIDEARQ